MRHSIALFLFRCLARFLVANPRIIDYLYESAKRNPYAHLHGYMDRDWLFPVPPRDFEKHRFPGEFPLMTWIMHKVFHTYARFHLLHRADYDKHKHNHPFTFYSLITRGWYFEEVMMPDGGTRTYLRSAGNVNYKKAGRDAGDYHRITSVSDGGVLTLVFHGRRNEAESWGFLVGDEHMHWKQYLGIESDDSSETVRPKEKVSA